MHEKAPAVQQAGVLFLIMAEAGYEKEDFDDRHGRHYSL